MGGTRLDGRNPPGGGAAPADRSERGGPAARCDAGERGGRAAPARSRWASVVRERGLDPRLEPVRPVPHACPVRRALRGHAQSDHRGRVIAALSRAVARSAQPQRPLDSGEHHRWAARAGVLDVAGPGRSVWQPRGDRQHRGSASRREHRGRRPERSRAGHPGPPAAAAPAFGRRGCASARESAAANGPRKRPPKNRRGNATGT